MDVSIIENTEKSLLEWKNEKTYPPKLKIPRTDILKRIEEDRERSKHLREDIWWVDKSIKDGEAIRLWEECSELDEGDYLEILAENFKYNPEHPWQDDYKKVLLWNAEQKRLEEEAAVLREKARNEKLEEEGVRKKREEELRVRRLREEAERKLQDQRERQFQEAEKLRVRQSQREERISQVEYKTYHSQDEVRNSQDKEIFIAQRLKDEETQRAQRLREEEEAQKVWQIVFKEHEQSKK
ncbi:3487_t:CDS:1, partial [Acaulospora colombiana]